MAQAKTEQLEPTAQELQQQLEATQKRNLELANREIVAICEAYSVELDATAGIQNGLIVAQPILRNKQK